MTDQERDVIQADVGQLIKGYRGTSVLCDEERFTVPLPTPLGWEADATLITSNADE
jgi:hypothetical protein